jgi:AraC-like DNA-binding protein
MIRATMARFYLRALLARHVTAAVALQGTGLTRIQLESPAHGIEPAQLRRLIANLVQLCPEPDLGLRLGSQLTIGDLGILGHGLMSCATIGEVSPLWDRHNELIGTLIRNESTIDATTWRLDFHEVIPLGELALFCYQQHFAATLALGCLLPQRPLLFRQLQVAFPAPATAAQWKKHFGCPIQFGSNANVILMDASELSVPLATADSEVFAVTVAHCRRMMERLEEQSGGIESRVRHELAACRSRAPRLPEIAARLGTSERSFHRLLQNEGLRFSDILNRHRRDLAFEYLRNTALSPKEIGYLLGFEDTSSFRRAFKEWTGMTLGKFIESQRTEPRVATGW